MQLDFNATAHAVTKTPKFHPISPILKSLHWFKINERIQYKVVSLTYKTLHSGHPSYLPSLLIVLDAIVLLACRLCMVTLILNRPSISLQNHKYRYFHHTARS